MNNRHRYPSNWEKISHIVRFVFYHGKCANCDLEHGLLGYYVNNQFFTEGAPMEKYRALIKEGYTHDQASIVTSTIGAKVIKVVLQCAHVDRNPENNALDNFVPLCEKCHLLYDREQRAHSVKYGSDMAKNQLNLFSDNGLK